MDKISRTKIIAGRYGKRWNIWKYATGKGVQTKDNIAFKHPAIFPDKLAEDHILSWTNEDEVVYDPMCGSGTTCKMSKKNNILYIGSDVSTEYCNIAEERLKLTGTKKQYPNLKEFF